MKKEKKISFLSIIIIILILGIVGLLAYEIVVTDFFGVMGEDKPISIGGIVNNLLPVSSEPDTTIENVSTEPIVIADNNKESNSTVSKSTGTKYYYNQLDTYGKLIYKGFEDNKENMKSGTYKIDFGNKFNDLLNSEGGEEALNIAFQSAWNAYTYDNMDVFYIDVEKLTLTTTTTSIGSFSTYTVELSNGENASYLDDNFNSQSIINNQLLSLEAMRSEICRQLQNYSTIDKVRQVHNWLIENVEYDVDLSTDEPYSIIGALTEGEAVCEGYARSFKYIMDGLGVPCVLISGIGTNSDGETESHAWNYVQIEGKWYAIDVTWDDPIIIGNGYLTEELQYRHFLKGSRTFFETHTEDGYITSNGMEFDFPELSEVDYY